MLCERQLELTFHHLIPRSLHKKNRIKKRFSKQQRQEGIWVCRSCHDAIHCFISNKALATEYNSLEALKTNERIAKHCAWAKKQNISVQRKANVERSQ